MPDIWEIAYTVEYATASDAETAKRDGRDISEGDELWRVVKAIGPLEADRDFWAGAHIKAARDDIRLASAAPELSRVLRAALAGTAGWQSSAADVLDYIDKNPEDMAAEAIADFM